MNIENKYINKYAVTYSNDGHDKSDFVSIVEQNNIEEFVRNLVFNENIAENTIQIYRVEPVNFKIEKTIKVRIYG